MYDLLLIVTKADDLQYPIMYDLLLIVTKSMKIIQV